MTREKVFEKISTERDYQDAKWGVPMEHPHEVGGWILLIQQHANDAAKAWSTSSNDREALEEIRKIAAIAVACGEQYGLQSRSPYLTKNAKLRGPA